MNNFPPHFSIWNRARPSVAATPHASDAPALSPGSGEYAFDPSVQIVWNFPALFQSRYSELLALADLQTDQDRAIMAEDDEACLTLLDRKQLLLQHMAERRPGSQELRVRWRAERANLDPAVRQTCETLLAQSEALIARLIDAEAHSLLQMRNRQQSTHLELDQVSRQFEFQQAYQTNSPPSASLLDLNR